MASGFRRLSSKALNRLFSESLGERIAYIHSLEEKPLLVNASLPSFSVRLRVYLYNCTNPPGGRASDEYKSQIIVPGQLRGQQGNFDFSDERIVLLGAYALLADTPNAGVFVFWDPMYHANFSYSANIQVKSEVLIGALARPVSFGYKTNNETIIACTPDNLIEGLTARIMTV